ncbi:MAG: SufD family Fe-S cluster assembly protein [Cytophagales bacterium]|jgi:Fe-S cluster assembly scaffold protein SufB|nr:SufD family Fe-S cluster assembly protein [Cytophagales bacterium]
MKNLNIVDENFLQISSDENLLLTGQNNFLHIYVEENIQVQIFIFNAEINFLECKILKNSVVNLDFISLNEKKNITKFDLQEGAQLNLKIISTKKITEETIVNLNEENSKFHGQYLVLAKNSNNCISTKIFHNAPKTFSDIANFGISLTEGNINFETTGKVAKGKSKSLCKQFTRGIILAENADIIAQPILLMEEFDVQAHHGVAIGKISYDELFYLMSRGLTEKKSEQLIISSLLEPFLETLLEENLKQKISNSIYSLL